MDAVLFPVLTGGGAEEPLCARCARVQASCCQLVQVYVTPGDARRVAEHTGREDFIEYALPDDPVYAEHGDDPNWSRYVFQPDGTRRVLRQRPGGDCNFLGPVGCTLPADVRPLLCRLYPFQFNEQRIHEQLGDHCPRHLLRPGQELLAALGMDRNVAEEWRKQLYQEIREEVNFHADRAHLRPAG